MDSNSNLTFETIIRAADKLKPLHPPEAVLTSPVGKESMSRAMPPAEYSSLASPFGMKIYEVDWVGEDEYFMGNPKLIKNLVEIGKIYGGLIARTLLKKVSREKE